MSHNNHIRSVAVLTMVVLVFGLLPAMAEDEPETGADGAGRIEAKIQFRGKGVSPEGIVLNAYHIDTKQLFRSEPAQQKGIAVIERIPYGYFDLAVEVGGELYVASEVVVVPPSGKVVITLILEPYEDDEAAPPREFQGNDSPVRGIARLSSKSVGKEFWRGPAGIAIITGISGAALLAIASGSESPSISPISP